MSQNNENELDFELDPEFREEHRDRNENRFKSLSEKVITASKERDEAKAQADAIAKAKEEAERERDFYKSFNSSATKYPGAGEFQDAILEKVKGGYDTEDAIVAVLAKEGRLGNQPAPVQQHDAPRAEGGSAPTVIESPKPVSDMSADEKLAQLQELERSGELGNVFGRGN